jgi:hypothetical protein
VHYEDLQNYRETNLLLKIDFTDFVFDRSREYVYRMNSFVMMHNSVHATAYVRIMKWAETELERWLICNDSKQVEVGLGEAQEDLASGSPAKRALFGFYERIAD